MLAKTVMEAKLVQSLNASYPMIVTELGMVIEVRLEKAQNAWCPMVVTELGMMVFLQPDFRVLEAVSIMALQLSRES